jgi:predicted nucleic acid-binding protein
LKFYPTYRGELSLTDVSTVVAMKSYGVKDVYSHDRDFDRVQGIRRVEEPR